MRQGVLRLRQPDPLHGVEGRHGQAQRPDGSVIPGLYAAGACASNLAQDGKGYCSGTQLGEGSFFGRRAGRHAAESPVHR